MRSNSAPAGIGGFLLVLGFILGVFVLTRFGAGFDTMDTAAVTTWAWVCATQGWWRVWVVSAGLYLLFACAYGY